MWLNDALRKGARPARLAGDHAAALQVFDADAALDRRQVETHDGVEDVANLRRHSAQR